MEWYRLKRLEVPPGQRLDVNNSRGEQDTMHCLSLRTIENTIGLQNLLIPITKDSNPAYGGN
jgi:hypothetical protein